MSESTLLTAKEAAEVFCVTRQRVYELIDQGKIEAYDYNRGVGNRWIKISRTSVEAFQKSCKIQAPSPVKPRYKN